MYILFVLGCENMNVRIRLFLYRNKAKLSHAELAELVGVDVLDIISYEKGEKMPDITVISKIAKACDVSVDELLVFYEKKYARRKRQKERERLRRKRLKKKTERK